MIGGGILTYMLLRWIHVDSRLIRFCAVIVGGWIGGVLGANLSALLWTILKWGLFVTVIALIVYFIFLVA